MNNFTGGYEFNYDKKNDIVVVKYGDYTAEVNLALGFFCVTDENKRIIYTEFKGAEEE